MIKRTIEISQQPLHLAIRQEQLVLRPPGPYTEAVASFPCEDVGLVIVDHPGSTYSHAALARLLDAGAVVVICGEKHLPTGMLLSFSQHTEVVWRLEDQIALPQPRRKRLWQQIVAAKIRNQAANIDHDPEIQRQLRALAGTVKSGDTTNVEAQAARIYWDAWLDESAGFRRSIEGGDGVNSQLNYGYAVLRSAVARALVSSGLHPALGLHHCNRSNAFCLADDFVEPLRPLVDRCVRRLLKAGCHHVDPQAKRELLSVLTAIVSLNGQNGPLLVQLQRSTASLARCIRCEQKRVELIEVTREDEPWQFADTE